MVATIRVGHQPSELSIGMARTSPLPVRGCRLSTTPPGSSRARARAAWAIRAVNTASDVPSSAAALCAALTSLAAVAHCPRQAATVASAA